METKVLKRFLLYFCFIILVANSFVISGMGLAESLIPSYGSIIYPTSVNVAVDFSKVIGSNNLTLATQIHHEWAYLSDYTELQRKLTDCKFGLVRSFVYHTQPCISWNEQTRMGVYDWTNFDRLMQTLQVMDIENIMMTVGHVASSGLPSGMNRNYTDTGLPNPESFATYCRDIALHVKNKGWYVKYWEPFNEPAQIFTDWTMTALIEAKYQALVNLFNRASDSILQVFPSALCGADLSGIKSFLDRFVYDARNVGFLSFHKYDAWATSEYHPEAQVSDEECLRRASLLEGYWTWPPHAFYTPQEMRDKWRSVRGVELPVICSETNMNSAWAGGSDPRIQQVLGGVWYAEELRAFVLSNVEYSVYFHFASYDSGEPTGGFGMGMVKMTPSHTEWYPYLTNYLFGNNLAVGDKIYESSSSKSTAVSTLAWKDSNSYNILLIGKVKDETLRVNASIQNASLAGPASIFIMDGTSPQLQVSTENLVNNTFVIAENGFFVVLVKIPYA